MGRWVVGSMGRWVDGLMGLGGDGAACGVVLAPFGVVWGVILGSVGAVGRPQKFGVAFGVQ